MTDTLSSLIGSSLLNEERPISLDDPLLEEMICRATTSTAEMAVTFFGNHITRPFCVLHQTILSLLDGIERFVAIAAPRGFGKTTLIGLCFIARLALFRIAPYIVYISATQQEAAQKVKTLARELVENDLIKAVFGNLQGSKWAEEKGEIELIGPDGKPFCFIQAKGAGNQIRGLKWGQHRPSIFLVDDLESKDDAQSEEQRLKLKKWFFGDLLGAIDNAEDSQSRVVLIGTIVHQDSLLANLLDEREDLADFDSAEKEETNELLQNRERFHSVRLEACDDNYESIWPEFISTERIRAKAESYRKRGLLDIFFMEFRNLVIAGEEATFQQSLFRYYSEQSEEFLAELKARQIESVVIVDPAKTANTSSAFTGIVGLGFNSTKGRIYVRDTCNKRLTPDDIYKEAYEMARLLGAKVIAVEVTGINNFITYPFRQFLNQKREFIELVEIKAIKDKKLRVAGLAPLYRMGAIYHNELHHVRGPLEAQLLSFPYSKYWDVMDCLANCIELFDIGDRNFANQSYLPGKTEIDEYEALYLEDLREEPVNFRSI